MTVTVNPILDHRRALVAIAAIPTLDCFCNQLNNAFHPHLGPIGFLQALRAVLMVALVSISIRAVRREPLLASRLPWSALGAALILSIILSKELVSTGGVQIENLESYGQLLYWILLWSTISLLCVKPAQAKLLLKGLAVGSLFTALSVMVGLAAGVGNFYTSDLVRASAGWFDTPKMITAILVVGGIVILYLGRGVRSWLPTVLAAFCFVACVLTYARAGMVALGMVCGWFIFWRLFLCDRHEGRWLNRLLVLLLLSCIVVPLAVDTHTLLARWSDVGESDRAGSGRAAFWKIAADSYLAADLPQQSLGHGYKEMSEMLFRDYGDDIKHTHNDMLDLLLVGGAAGAVWFIGLILAFLKRALRSPIDSAAGAASIAIVLVYLCHSQLTGQIWGTDAMTYYTVSLTCFSCIGSSLRSPHPVRSVQQAQRPLHTTTLKSLESL